MGHLGLGKIAHKFAHDLALVSSAELYAVASSSVERAYICPRTQASNAYGDYSSLFNDESVEVIYIASVHTDHHSHSCAALAGKAVYVKSHWDQRQRSKRNDRFSTSKKLFLWKRFGRD